MTTANKITLFRFIIIPFMVVAAYLNLGTINLGKYTISTNQLIFLLLFLLGALSDFLDGYIARKHNQITTFGKFLDPIADKVLVLTAMLFLLTIYPKVMPMWTIVIIIIREFMVTGVRLLAVENGNVIAASPYGKMKTVVTMVALIYLLFNIHILSNFLFWLGFGLWQLAVLLTLISGIDYLVKNKEIIFESF